MKLEFMPSHWKIMRLRHLLRRKLQYGANEEGTERNPAYPRRYIRITDFGDDGLLREDTFRSLPPHVAELPSDAVVFSRDATIGLCAITAGPRAVSQHFIAWLCGSELIPRYLLYVLRVMGQHLDSLTMGATIKTIGMPEVRSLTIPLPPKVEQERIVEQILEQSTAMTTAIEKAEREIELIQELRTTLISAAVSGTMRIGAFYERQV